MKLTLKTYLKAVRDYQNYAAARLVIQGVPWKLILSRAERSAKKGYTDYGTSPAYVWLTPKGKEMLEQLEKEEA